MGARRKAKAAAAARATRASPRLGVLAAQHLAVLSDSLRRLARRPINSLLTLGVIAIALALPAALYVGIKNLASLDEDWRTLGEISLYLSPGLDEGSVGAVAERLQARPDLLEVRRITPEQGREAMAGIAGFGAALEALPDNPLPWVLVVRPATTAAERLAALAAELGQWPEVDAARVDLAWLGRLRALLDLGRQTVFLAAVLLGLALVLVIGNTIRLDIENRRREVEVTRLLGATDAFIRRPFLYAGVWYGLGGGLAASVLVQGLAWMLETPVGRLADAYNSNFALAGLGAAEALALVLLGSLIGWSGSWLAVSRQLAGIQPE